MRLETLMRERPLFFARALGSIAALVGFASTALPAWAQTPILAGYRDFNYGSTAINTPTGEKPESKLWWNDGFWWGILWDPASNRYEIHKFNVGTQSWASTNVAADTRSNAKADALWDGTNLFIAFHVFANEGGPVSPSQAASLYRYSYNAGTDQYSLDFGFPVTINGSNSETLVLAKDGTGQLWITWTERVSPTNTLTKVMINHSMGTNHLSWGTPYRIPVQTQDADPDDIASVIALPGKIGVFWSDQENEVDYFAVHLDGAADDVWQPRETALIDPVLANIADDHISMVADPAGNLYVATKTSLNLPATNPIIYLLKRTPAGVWSRYVVATVGDQHTRAIVQLDDGGNLYVFMTYDPGGPEPQQLIYLKSTNTSNIQFPTGFGTPFIQSTTDDLVNNSTGTKQLLNATTDLLVIASDQSSHYYMHNMLPIGSTGPSIASFLPLSGVAGTEVTLTGSGFTGATNVRFNGLNAPGFVLDNANQIRVNVPVGATTGPISVEAPSGTGISSSSFTIQTVPTVASFLPTSGPPATEVTVSGTGFLGTTNVTFNGVSATYTVDSNTQLRANVPVGATTGPIAVTNGVGTGTSASNFTVTAPPPVVTFAPIHDARVEAANPTTSFPGTGTGTNLLLRVGVASSNPINSYLKFNVSGLAGPVVDAKLRLFCNDDSPDGGRIYAVSNNYLGTSTPWLETGLNWNNAPTIGGTILDQKANVPDESWVEFNVTPAITGNGVFSLGITSPHVNLAAYYQKEGVSPPQLVVTIAAGAPTIANFNPTSGPPGTQVTVTGTNFSSVTAVTFNGVAAASFIVDNATQLRATVPAAAGSGPIGITNSNGTTFSATNFTVDPPTITNFTPTSGHIGATVVITGTQFSTVSSVRFNGVSAGFVINNPTQITATVPSGATTGPISVLNPAGSASSGTNFTVILPPTIASFNPTSGPSGTQVTVTGTQYSSVTAVTFNGVAASSFIIDSPTQLRANVPNGTNTGPIGVTNLAATTNSATNFTVVKYTLATTPVGSGTIGRVPDQPSYDNGTTVQLTATPSVGWTFTGWTGDASGTTNPVNVLMNANKTVTGTFTVNTYTLAVTPIGSGTVGRVPDQPTYNHGTSVQLTATPAVGWTFTGWTGALTGTTNPANLLMDGNKSVTATFTINTYTLGVTTVGLGAVEQEPEPGDLRPRDERPADRNPDGGVDVYRLEWRRYRSDQSAQPGDGRHQVGDRNVLAQRLRDECRGGRVRLGRQESRSGDLQSRDQRPADRNAGNGVDVHELERRRHRRHQSGHRTDGREQDGDRDLHHQHLHAGCHERGLGLGHEESKSGHLRPRHERRADRDPGHRLDVHRLERQRDRHDQSGQCPDGRQQERHRDFRDQHLHTRRDGGRLRLGRQESRSAELRPRNQRRADRDPGRRLDVQLAGAAHATGSTNPVSVLMDANKSVTATFTINTYTLGVTIVGSGSVAKNPDQGTYDHGTSVELTAVSATGWTFAGWSDDATGVTNPVNVLMDDNKSVTVTFTINTYTLGVTVVGSGSVAKNPDQPTYEHGTNVELTATPDPTWNFIGWSGDATGLNNPVNVLMDANKSVTATFALNAYALSVTLVGSGSVARNPDQASYDHGTSVELTATPATGWTFTGWSGDASGSTNPVTVLMEATRNVTATFTVNTYTLAVDAIGSGSVSWIPDQPTYDHGTIIALTASPSPTWHLVGWSGDASGSESPLNLLMDGNKSVIATFALNTYTLSVTVVGSGSVGRNPDQPSYDHGTTVDLTANPATGWTFTGWSGDATGTTNPVNVLMDANKSVTATFTANTYTLAVNTVGSGTVAKNPDQPSYDHGTSVELTASPVTGWTFTGWSGDATGSTNPVNVLMDGNKSVTATFTINTYTLAVTTVGSGSVAKNPDQATYDHGTSVQLTAAPDPTWNFVGWSGGATGTTNPVNVLMDANKSVTATFALNAYALSVTVVGSGTVAKNPDQATYGHGTSVELTANAAAGWTFSDWSGDATGSTNPVNVLMDANKSVTATFTINTYTLGVTIVGSGSVAKNPDQPTYNHGTSVQLTATPDPTWNFVGWSGAATGTTNPVSVLMDANKSVTATFALNAYALSVTVVGSGTVAKNPDQATYGHGTSVELTANAATGWTFSGWSGAATGSTNPVNLVMDANKSVTATFTVNTYTLGVTIVGSGSVAKNPDQPTYNHGTSVQLTAMPAAGWMFSAWSGDASGTTNPVNVVMDANKSVTASFAINPQQLTFNPQHDGRVQSDNPTRSYGTGTGTVPLLRVRNTGPTVHSYLKFQLSGLAGPAASAKLRLFCVDASTDGGGVYSVSNNYVGTSTPWVETGLTWNTAPGVSGAPLAQVGNANLNAWVEVDVTSAITGDGTFSFALTSASTNIAGYESKEGANPPQLVINGGGVPNLTPTVQSFTPTSGIAGTEVTIAGTHFTGATGASFGGVAASSFTVDSDVQVRATVAAGAVTGPVRVTTPEGTGVSASNFTIIAPPTVSNFSPGSGSPGTQVTLIGTGFGLATSVAFNAVAATFIVDSDAQIRATVPGGATTGPISVGNPAGTGTSPSSFVVTAPPPQVTFTPVADARVQSANPTTNYGSGSGTNSLLRVRSTGPTINSYLKFQVAGVSGPVVNAKLRLFCVDESVDGGRVYSVSNNYVGTSTPWLENGLIWNNAPAISGSPLSQHGAVPINAWVEFDVTAAVTGDGTYSFALASNSTNIVGYNSKESATPPQLVIDVGTGAAAATASIDIGASSVGRVSLGPAYPNPFRSQVSMRLELPREDRVRLEVYDVLGRRVKVLADGDYAPGAHEFTWDGRNEIGARVEAGIYMIHLEAQGVTARRKAVLVR